MGTNNYKTNNNNNCTRSSTPTSDINNIYKVAEKAINDIAKDINKMAEATGVKTEDIITRLMAELKISVGDIDTSIGDIKADVPILSNNTFNISIGNITVAERGGKIKNKKKGGKKNKK